jgi:geranylgeranyl diphosphate synthase type I
MRYHLGWIDENGRPRDGTSGKALRPVLCLMACEATCGRYEPALPVAAALELVHNFSLIHDDIQDDDRERRHRPTVWSIWGKPQAINAGTAMRILANAALSRMELLGVGPQKRLALQNRLDETTLRLIEGQYLDIDFENRPVVRLSDYLEMVEGKTASLIACALQMGAMVGTEDASVQLCYAEMGKALGFAFQICDDILGIWGDTAQTGKPAGNDIVRRKKSLPIVYAIEKSRDGQRQRLLDLYRGTISDREVGEVLAVLDDLAVRPAAEALVAEYSARARAALDRIALSDSNRRDFEQLIDTLAVRSA